MNRFWSTWCSGWFANASVMFLIDCIGGVVPLFTGVASISFAVAAYVYYMRAEALAEESKE